MDEPNEVYSSKALIHATRYVKLRNITRNEMEQATKEYTLDDFIDMKCPEKGNSTETENRLVVVSGWGE